MKGNSYILSASVSLSFFFWGMLGVSIGALLPNAMDEFALSPLMGGMVFVLWSIGFSLGSLAAEKLLRRYGAVVVLAVLSASTAGLCALQFAAARAEVFLAVYSALGLCGGAVFTASHTLFGEVFARSRSSALAVLDVVFSVGNMAAPLLIVVILQFGSNWQTFYLLGATGFALMGGIFALLLLRQRSAGSQNHIAPEKRAGLNSLPWKSLTCLAIGSFSLGAIEWTQNVWFVTYALENAMPQDLSRLGLSIFTAGMIASRLSVIGFATASRSALVQRAMLGLAFAGELIVILSGNASLMLIGNFLLGAGIGGLFPMILGRAMDQHPAASAALSMLMIVSLTLGGQVASFAIGALAESLSVTIAFQITIPLIVVMALSLEGYRKTTGLRAPNAS